jgi:hypothetical protein
VLTGPSTFRVSLLYIMAAAINQNATGHAESEITHALRERYCIGKSVALTVGFFYSLFACLARIPSRPDKGP